MGPEVDPRTQHKLILVMYLSYEHLANSAFETMDLENFDLRRGRPATLNSHKYFAHKNRSVAQRVQASSL